MGCHVLENCSAFSSRSPTLMTATTLRWWSTWDCSCSLLPWSQHPLQTVSPSWDLWRRSCAGTYFKWVWLMVAWNMALGSQIWISIEECIEIKCYEVWQVCKWALSCTAVRVLKCAKGTVAKPEMLSCCFLQSRAKKDEHGLNELLLWDNTVFSYNWFGGNYRCKLPA